MMSGKEKIVKELNQILQVRDIHWNLLPDTDLMRLLEAFQRLKADVDAIFNLFDEVFNGPLTVEDSKKERSYVV